MLYLLNIIIILSLLHILQLALRVLAKLLSQNQVFHLS